MLSRLSAVPLYDRSNSEIMLTWLVVAGLSIRSVSDAGLAQHSRFASNLQQSRSQMTAGGGSLAAFSFPQAARAAGGAADNSLPAVQEEEEDLYS